MNWIIVVVIVLLVAGIAYFGGNTSTKKKSREELLKDLARMLEGEISPVEGYENSYKIDFEFEGHKFCYEDLEATGFKDKVYKSYLKAKTATNLTMTFGEKRRASLLEHQFNKKVSEGVVHLPSILREFQGYSNNPSLAEELFRDQKVGKVFYSFRNVDQRGKPFLCLKITGGMIILEFRSDGNYNPRPLRYSSDQTVVEEYLDQLILVKNRLESV